MSIPWRIRRHVPNVVPISPVVWQLPKTFEFVTPPPPKTPWGIEWRIVFSLYPFPDESADMYQIRCQPVQPFYSFPRVLNVWPPPPQMPTGVLRGDLYLAYVHSQMNPQTWTQVGANRTASRYFWIVDPLKPPPQVPLVSRGFSGALAEDLMIFCRHVITELYI